MNGELGQRVNGAEGNVKGQPDKQQPASPVAAAEHERSAEDRQKPNDGGPDEVGFKWMLRPELGGVVR